MAIADGGGQADGPTVKPSVVSVVEPGLPTGELRLAVAALSSAAFFRDAATKHYGLCRDSPAQAAWGRILTSRVACHQG